MPAPSKHANLNLFMLTALVTGNMIGSGIFLLPSSLASFGTIGLLAWLCTAVGALFLALVFAKLGHLMPRVGGPYAYCREAFGDCIGFLIAYNYWIALWVGNAAIVIAFIGYLDVFFPTIADNNWLSFWVSVGTVWFLTAINIMGVRSAGVVQAITTVLKIVPLLFIGVVGLFYVEFDNLRHFNITGTGHWEALSGAAALTLWSFIGVESATVPADNIDNPTRNIPIATIVGTLVTAFVYIFSAFAVMGTIPLEHLQQSSAPYAEAALLMIGSWGSLFVALGAAISCFGALNGWILLQGQVPKAAADDYLFPRVFALENKSGTPYAALIISSCLITLLLLLTVHDALVEQFTFVISLAVFATLLPYVISTMAQLLILMKKGEKLTGPLIRTIVITILAFLYSFWTIIGSGPKIVYYGTMIFFSGLPVYVWIKYYEKKLSH